MKKSTRVTLWHLAYSFVLIVLFTFLQILFNSERTFTYHVVSAAFIYVAFSWFYLAHRTPEGKLDMISITGRKFW